MSEPSQTLPRLHLSDDEFRSETIYFIVTDRFNSGKRHAFPPSELDDPTRKDWNKYWGGNLQGIIDKLDYLSTWG